jgi:GxxExxY protein
MTLMKPKQPDRHTIVRGGDHAGLVDEALTREVIGAFYKVYNTLGHGFLESVYSRALYIELRRRGFDVKREVTVTAFYERYPVGHFRVDLLVEGRLAVELKAGRSTVPEDRQQLQNWLRASNLTLGLLFHFGPRPTFCRLISEKKPRRDPAVSARSALSLFSEKACRRVEPSEGASESESPESGPFY